MNRMSEEKQRDDNFLHRLSSFVDKSGGLTIKRIKKIKPHIFEIKTVTENIYILKSHANHARVQQQWEFFKELDGECFVPFIPFPNGKETIEDGPITWTISPFIKGSQLTYQDGGNRKNALCVLQTFHTQAKNIHLHHATEQPLLIHRMKKRFRKFTQSESIFKQYGYESLFEEVCIATSKLFEIASLYPWQEQMTLAKKRGVWIHGDVASHNFIQSESTLLIDFDLLQPAPQLYDYIQLGQRFMPYLGWDLESLLTYKMVVQRNMAIWLLMIGLPSDLMRDWQHAKAKTDLHMKTFLQKTREEWELRKIFLRNVETMLQS